MKYYHLLLFLLIWTVSSKSQNLLINGDFDINSEKDVPVGWVIGKGTPDLFKYSKNVHVDNEPLPPTESNYIGISFNERWTEFYYSKFRTIIEPDELIDITLDVYYYRICKNGFDTLFLLCSKDKDINSTDFKINFPMEHVPLGKWTTLRYTFKAERFLNYFAIGCFELFSKSIALRKRKRDITDLSSFGCKYLFFDNISISKRKNSARSEVKNGVVYFDTGNFELNITSSKYLDTFYTKIIKHKSLTIELIGYADDVGSTSSNMTLSELRANSVKQALISSGMKESIITIKNGGEINSPDNSSDLISDRKINRRVTIQAYINDISDFR